MNIKLHNKFEISQGDETYVAYNTLTHNILDSIKTFENYTAYFVFGNGTTSVGYSSDKMSNYVASFASTLEEIQCNPLGGDLFVKRTVTLNENEQVGLTFCEIGMSSSSALNPDICNHVQIKNNNNEVINVVKKSGQIMFIRLTVYLEIESGASYLCGGNNNLIKALLGEYNSSTFTAKRGYVLADNSAGIYRNVPRINNQYNCTVSSSIQNDTLTINIGADIESGETKEVVYLLGGSPVLRYSLASLATEETETETITSEINYILPIDDNVKQITSVTDSNSQAVTGYVQKTFAKSFGDYVAGAFINTISANDARWVSEDGDKIAFLSGGSLHFYKNQSYMINKLSANVPANNVKNIIMFEDNVFVIYTSIPHVRMYKIENNELIEKNVDFSVYETFDNSYAWQDEKIIKLNNGTFLFGVVLGQASRNPALVYATYSSDTLTVTSASYGQCDYIVSMFALYQSSFFGSMIGFITNNYNGTDDNYRIEEYYQDGTNNITHEFQSYYMVNDSISLKGQSRAAVIKKSQSPYIWLYYYPQLYRYSISLTPCQYNWISPNLMYYAQKFVDGQNVEYKVYCLTNYNNPVEFDGGIPSDIDQSTIQDLEFLNDTLLIFTSSGIVAINLNQTYTVLENVPNTNESYTVSYKKNVYLGTDQTEGLQTRFTIEVSA